MQEFFKKFLNKYIRFVQKILINILLFFVYFVLFGVTKIIIMIFQPALINFNKKETPKWEKPKVNEYNYKLVSNPW